MSELKFEPASMTPPMREPGGLIVLGRLTTTAEQRREAEAWIVAQMQKNGTPEARCTVVWTRGDPTILDVRARVEQLSTGSLYCLDLVTEFSMSGAEIHDDPKLRMDRLLVEVTELTKANAF